MRTSELRNHIDILSASMTLRFFFQITTYQIGNLYKTKNQKYTIKEEQNDNVITNYS